jgi:nucleoside-diphosphate-sugar epimerase
MDKVVVTGATGYIGEKLVEKLIQQDKYVHAVARNEGKLLELKSKHKHLEIFPCPVENEYLISKAAKDCSGIFHLASFKDVNLAEKHALKTIETNILGTLNLLKATIETLNSSSLQVQTKPNESLVYMEPPNSYWKGYLPSSMCYTRDSASTELSGTAIFYTRQVPLWQNGGRLSRVAVISL